MHDWGTVDDCVRCLDCEVLKSKTTENEPCPSRSTLSAEDIDRMHDDWNGAW